MKNQQLMTRDEIRSTQFTSLYDVISSLRGNWLRVRGADSFSQPTEVQVYLDTQRIGGAGELRAMNPVNIESVRYFDSVQASARWGPGHGSGAIYVLSAKR